ncbi:MAG: hypothetical protein HW413_2274 [Thermoleophilia bacterium]|nr:hypothetical protein [Thermoleophilia bacterium]
MTDASILIPTHRHVALLPWAIRSALDQDGVSVEVLVVGDGVEDATRDAIARFADDPRVRFFDLPKGPRLGEAYRHAVLQEATGRIVSYLSDDDVLLRDHVLDMLADGSLVFRPWDMSRPEFAWHMRSGRASVGLTAASHTLEAYTRLPHGWRTTPPGMPTDRYMWLQWLDQSWFRGVTSHRLTHLHFPEPMWKGIDEEERTAVLADWYERSRRPGFRAEIDELMALAILRGGEEFRLRTRRLELELERVTSSRAWRLREFLVSFRPLRALLARRHGAG